MKALSGTILRSTASRSSSAIMPRVLHVEKTEGKPGQVYYPLKLKDVPKPEPGPGQLLVRLTAAALNHRDLFIRQHLYPGISFTHPLFADGSGTVVALGPDVSRSSLLNKSVVLTPMRGWESQPSGPEDVRKFSITGGTSMYNVGCGQDFIAVNEDEVEEAPQHLSAVEAAALPLVGLTGWRALVTKSGAAESGNNILITGIGGGVALQVLQFAVALGVNAYVTSGDEAKIEKAKKIGAKGGVIYKNREWHKEMQSMLPKDRPYLDAVIDGAGGDIVTKSARLLKPGGVIAAYGMTVGPKMDWLMSAVLANIELKGTTMGSKKEFREMIAFVNKNKIKPVISRTVKGLDNLDEINGLFEDLKAGSQFGKLVIEIGSEGVSSSSKL